MPIQTWTDDFHGTDYFASGRYNYLYGSGSGEPSPISDNQVVTPVGSGYGLRWNDSEGAFTPYLLISASIWVEFTLAFGDDFGGSILAGFFSNLYNEYDSVWTQAVYLTESEIESGDTAYEPAFQSSGFNDWQTGVGVFDGSLDEVTGRVDLDLLPDGTVTRLSTGGTGSPSPQTAVVPYINDLLDDESTLYPQVWSINGANLITSWGYTIVTALPVQSVSTISPGVGSAGALPH